MRFQLVPKSVTLNDLARRNGTYFVLFYRISGAHCVKVVDKAGQLTITMYSSKRL